MMFVMLLICYICKDEYDDICNDNCKDGGICNDNNNDLVCNDNDDNVDI